MLLIDGVIFLGTAVLDVARELGDFLVLTSTALNERDLDEAASHLARAITILGVAAFIALLAKIVSGRGGKGAGAEEASTTTASKTRRTAAPQTEPRVERPGVPGKSSPEPQLEKIKTKAPDAKGATLPKQTGAGGPVSSEEAHAAAERTYDQIRADTTDVDRIAQTTGIKPENIQTVKDHVFNDEHLLDKYRDYGVEPVSGRFDADPNMAASWQRLKDGSFTDADMQLLRHETAEAWYMRNNGPSYLDAHTAAELRYPSPY